MIFQQRRRAARPATARTAKRGAAAEPASARTAPGPRPSRKLFSMAGLLRDRSFAGEFNARGATYHFTYSPTTAAMTNRKLELTGNLSVRGPGGATRTMNNVRATMLAQQGGLGASITRRQVLTGTTTGADTVSTPDQQQEQAKAPETTPQPAVPPVNPPLTVAEWSGPLSFVGAMYFRFQPLDGVALGVPLDLSKVQLNVRLAPDNPLERDLQFLYSDLIEAAYGERPDERKASSYAKELNRVLKG